MDLLLNERCTIGCFPWCFVDGESSIARIVAFVEDARHEELMAKKAECQLTRFGDVTGVCKQLE
jgi:arylformamidase